MVCPLPVSFGAFLLDHISLGVSDLKRSIGFYDAILAPMGVLRVWTSPDAAGYGFAGGEDGLAIKAEPAETVKASRRTHLAFTAGSRDAVCAFHAAGIARGACDDGAPALCPEYGGGYFAAFLRDPDGYRLEAVFHMPQDANAGVGS